MGSCGGLGHRGRKIDRGTVVGRPWSFGIFAPQGSTVQAQGRVGRWGGFHASALHGRDARAPFFTNTRPRGLIWIEIRPQAGGFFSMAGGTPVPPCFSGSTLSGAEFFIREPCQDTPLA